MTARPLIISDCDEVLLHMVVPFGEWLDEEKGVHFDLESGDFVDALRHKHDGTPLDQETIWPLLKGFFDTEMHRQQPIDGAVDALERLSARADIVILTNLMDDRRDARAQQLRAVGIDYPVFCNQGGKGAALADILATRAPPVAVYIDDLANQHGSVAKHNPGIWQIQMVGEPRISASVTNSDVAHARIDRWTDAVPWIEAKLDAGVPAPAREFDMEESRGEAV